MIILGIGGIVGDSASAILKDGKLVAAIEESKLVRRRTHWGGHGEMPEHSITACLELAGAKASEVDAIGHDCDAFRVDAGPGQEFLF